jgi:hypothetical protein
VKWVFSARRDSYGVRSRNQRPSPTTGHGPVLLLLLTATAFAQPAPALLGAAPSSAPSLFDQVGEITATLSDITGWTVRKRVPSEMLSKTSFRRFVESHMKDKSSREDVRIEELTLKMFGLVPQDFNLARETVDLVSEQAAAYYDYNKKRLFILDSTNEGAEQRIALVHELAHALADQHHPLGKYLHKGSPDDDASTARQAVMEGQATWLTWAYMSKRSGGKAEVPPAMLEEAQPKASPSESAQFPVFATAPLYLRESLVFPYDEGLRFQDAVFHKLGARAFDEVFLRPPRSTQQILHADTYLADKKPTEPEPPALASEIGKNEAKRFRLLAEGSFGEFDHSVLLRQYIGEREGRAAARHWSGGAFRIYENKTPKYPVLSYVSEWDSPAAARAYFELYQRVMHRKWKKMEVAARSESEISGSGDSGRFHIRLSKSTITSVEGLR